VLFDREGIGLASSPTLNRSSDRPVARDILVLVVVGSAALTHAVTAGRSPLLGVEHCTPPFRPQVGVLFAAALRRHGYHCMTQGQPKANMAAAMTHHQYMRNVLRVAFPDASAYHASGAYVAWQIAMDWPGGRAV